MYRTLPFIICVLAANASVAESASRSLSVHGELNCSNCQVVDVGICEFVEGAATVLMPCVESSGVTAAQLAELIKSRTPAVLSVFNTIREILDNPLNQHALSVFRIGVVANYRWQWRNWICEKGGSVPIEKDNGSRVGVGVVRVVLLLGILYVGLCLAGKCFRPSSSWKGYSGVSSRTGGSRSGSARRLERWCLLWYFGINLNSPAHEIRKKYRQKLQSIHPDTNPSAPFHVDAGSQIEELRVAYLSIRALLENPVEHSSECCEKAYGNQ